MNTENDIQEDVKNITIRGVDLEAYNEFSNKLKDFNMNVGDAFNRIIGDVMNDFDEVFPDLSADSLRSELKKKSINIAGHGTLSISRKDLEEADKRINSDIYILQQNDGANLA